MTPQGKRTTRRNSYRRRRSSPTQGGANPVPPPNHIMSRQLLIVPNAEQAIFYAGANLLAAPGWCVVCDAGEKSLFYKTMSRMGVYDYHYGFETVLEDGSGTVLDEFSKLAWCSVFTPSQKVKDAYDAAFDYQITLLETSPSNEMLHSKLNRMKTIEVRRMENYYKNEGYPLLATATVPNAEISSEMQDIPKELQTGGERVVVMNESNFTLTNILDSLQVGSTIVYLPSTSSPQFLNRLRGYVASDGPKLDTRKRIDLLFVSAPIKSDSTNPDRKFSFADQYLYEIDMAQPMLIRSHNYVIKKLFGMLEIVEDLRTVFKSNYQFLSRLRMAELRPAAAATGQKGGAYDYDDDDAESVDPYEFLYGPIDNNATTQGGRRRRKFSYRRRARSASHNDEKLKGGRRRMSFRRRFGSRR